MRITVLAFLATFCSAVNYGQNTVCPEARLLCDKTPFQVDQMPAVEDDALQKNGIAIPAGFPVTNPVWIKWAIKDAGSLSFVLTPVSPGDDLDFILFRLKPSGICDAPEIMRIMTTGPVLGEPDPDPAICNQQTGLQSQATVPAKEPACSRHALNFLEPVNTHGGEWYALLVNNFRSSKGFHIEFSGTGIFDPGIASCSSLNTGLVPDYEVGFSEIYPNPATGQAYIAIKTPESLSGSMILSDITGRPLRTLSFTTIAGVMNLEIPVNGLSQGTYLLYFQVDGYKHTAPLIKF